METPDCFSAIRAILFDLDGTLIDSERFTDRAIAELLAQRGIPSQNIDFLQFHGISWERLDLLLKQRFPELQDADVLSFLEERFYQFSAQEPPPLLPGAREAFLQASAIMPVAIVTGSGATDVESFLARADLVQACSFYLSYEMYSPSKPDPSCYQMASERLALTPDQCLVFEDSLPGLSAARSAGMHTVAVTHSSLPPEPGLADLTIDDYTQLAAHFFSAIQQRSP